MQDRIQFSSCVALADDARFRSVCGEGVVLNQETAEVLVISPVASRVLELMKQDGSIAVILSRLREEYDVEDDALERDVLAFLNEMAAAGAVRPAVGVSAR